MSLLDSDGVTGLRAEVVQELSDTGLAVLVLALGVDDPDLAEVNGGGESSAFLVAGDELDVLDTTSLLKISMGPMFTGVEMLIGVDIHQEW